MCYGGENPGGRHGERELCVRVTIGGQAGGELSEKVGHVHPWREKGLLRGEPLPDPDVQHTAKLSRRKTCCSLPLACRGPFSRSSLTAES